jgi:hypothetical protein
MKTKEQVLVMALEIEAQLNNKQAALSGDQMHDMAIRLNTLCDVLEDGKII